MIIRNVEQGHLNEALEIVNDKYDGNVVFNRYEHVGKGYRITLRVKSSKGPGHRLGFIHPGRKQRRLVSACWHVHGEFFDALWKIQPGAVIHAGLLTMRGPSDNWQDRNIGSMVYPMMYSDACECGGRMPQKGRELSEMILLSVTR